MRVVHFGVRVTLHLGIATLKGVSKHPDLAMVSLMTVKPGDTVSGVYLRDRWSQFDGLFRALGLWLLGCRSSSEENLLLTTFVTTTQTVQVERAK
jgi:hypothetical protein